MITNIKLQNFRSYIENELMFDKNTNIIVGPNAAGKTNILEALLISRVGSSYRTKDINLITFGKKWARIDSTDNNNKRVVKIMNNPTTLKTFTINSKEYKRLPPALKLPVVLFEPNHLQILNGAPEGRRAYLDSLIEQIDPGYGSLLRKYQRALAQRNALLKNQQRLTNNLLFPWNIRISQLAGQLVPIRNKVVEQINKSLPSVYSKLSKDKITATLIYRPQLQVDDYQSRYLKVLDQTKEDDVRASHTLIGPHRDDLVFMFGKYPSSTYASRGELRTAVLALKVVELEMLTSHSDYDPIMLLDDVYSELDILRRKALTGYLKNTQSFITTTDADVVNEFKTTSNIIRI
ncbi:MAG: DNA replication/repair protein RecF [Candidatus Saccharimonadales bacterium]